MEWQAIDTAPRDGRKIILFPTNGHHSRHNEPQPTIGYWYQPPNLDYKGMWITWNACRKPTHWMPLPRSPFSTVNEIVQEFNSWNPNERSSRAAQTADRKTSS